ncbi:MAG: hypothetical protein OXG78_08705 [Chloroflexi bacterium]|nr:hypothetical protein [Chloroflexota bacterium]
MPKRTYTPAEKKLVRRLLLIHNGNVPIVHHLTGFPRRTIHSWREQWDDNYELYTDALAQNLVSRANALATAQQAAIQGGGTDSAFAQSEDRIAQFRQIRANLMKHATTLSHNLALDDGQVNQRVHALSRLIDRLLMLEGFLDDQIPQELPPNRIIFQGEDGFHEVWEGQPPHKWTEVEDRAQTEPDQSGELFGSAQENDDESGLELADILEARRRARNGEWDADLGKTPDTAPFDDSYGGIF